MSHVSMILDGVDVSVREGFVADLVLGGATSSAQNAVTVDVEDMEDCLNLGVRVAPLLPPVGRRFKLVFDGPGATTTLYEFAIPGEEAETVAGYLATCAGLQ